MNAPDSLLARAHGLEFDVAGFSEQGPRSENQDAYRVERFEQTGVLAVADGMGGEKSGRTAADTALEAVLEAAPLRSIDDARRAARAADAAVMRVAEGDRERLGGMGCALAVLGLVATRGDGPGWAAAHVGDVRILSRSPDGAVRLETRDHTPAYARWEAGEIGLDEIPDTPGANRLQRAVGRGGEPDAAWLPVRAGWTWAIVSDGVTKAMRLDEIGAALAAPTAATACELIRQKVLEREPDDNFTAVVVRAGGGAPPAADATATATHPPSAAMNRTSTPPPAAPPRAAPSWGAVLLALLALAAAGFALWTALGAQRAATDRTELEQLRLQVDSLRQAVSPAPADTLDPFGPTDAPAPQPQGAAPAGGAIPSNPARP